MTIKKVIGFALLAIVYIGSMWIIPILSPVGWQIGYLPLVGIMHLSVISMYGIGLLIARLIL